MTDTEDLLREYREKRDFGRSPEPKGKVRKKRGNFYSIQKHDARRLHYDLRLELDGVLKSWAITKGPSLDPADKRLAVRTEDHPVDYAEFEGVIGEGYGKGTVLLWDRGRWTPKGDAKEGLKNGELKFVLEGERLKGGFALIRMKGKKKEKRENWLLIKERDDEADRELDPTEEWTTSVGSDRDLAAIADEGERYDSGDKDELPPKRRKANGSGTKKGTSKRNGTKGGGALRFIEPQLATLEDAPPKGAGWIHEIKFDGYRLQALIEDGNVRLITRNGKDWTDRYPSVAKALSKPKIGNAIIDGELVALDKDGHGNFGLLQNRGQNKDISLRYYAFDLLHLDGEDLRDRPLTERKERLEPIADDAGEIVEFSDHVEGKGERVIARACDMGLEGVVSKKADAPYRSGRGRGWIKAKCVNRDEFVIAGYRRSDKRGRPFASLLLAEHAGGALVYRGRVGTGFDESIFESLSSKMKPLERKTCPIADAPGEAHRGAVWLTPKLVGQVSYTEETSDGRLRHPVFLGLREDKPAEKVRAMDRNADDETTLGGVRLTHPDRVMYPQQGATKRATAQHYLDCAERMLPFLADRPVTLVRCPRGRAAKCFFQKHHNDSVPDEIRPVEIAEKNGRKSSYLNIDSAAGLVAAAQIGALELHIWGSRADRLERPERLVFDLDPDESIGFADVRDAAREIRDVLEAADLISFPMLTGGKGIHVIVPLERRRGWDDVKTFARGLARRLAEADPDRYLAQASKARRKGRIFIDWLRNERGATAVAPYSLRAREGAPVATPVSWDELPSIDSAANYTLDNIGRRLSALKSDPWPDYFDLRQSITAAHMKSVSGD